VIADMCAVGSLLAAPTGTIATQLKMIAGAAPHTAGSVVVQGPGGTGKTLLLGELAAAYRRAGFTLVDPDDPDPAPPPEGFAVVVDDAQRLGNETAGRLRRLLRRPGARLALAFRPWPRPTALAGLVDELGPGRRSIVLSHVDRSLVLSWTREKLGPAATPALVDAVVEQTGGLPALVHPLLDGLAARREGMDRPDPGGPVRLLISPDVIEVVRAGLTELDDDTHTLLHAIAAGAPVDAEVLADLLDLPAQRTTALVALARASGLLLGSGMAIPLVRSVLLAMTPPDLTRDARRRLLRLLLDRGEEPIELARVLAAEGVRDPRAALLLERHADQALKDDPALAQELLGAAAASGAPVAGLAARRAHAAALAGDFDVALQWADPVLADGAAPDRPRAAGVIALVLAHRGLLPRSAELYRQAGPDRAGSTALALLATGSAAEAVAVLDEADRVAPAGSPTMLAGAEELMARGILQSLRVGPDAGADIAAALSTLTRAAALLEPIGRHALLMDTPAALAALVALHCGELGVAESVLRRALAADVGGAPTRTRHLLLLAWVAMLRGRMTRTRECMARAQAAAHTDLEPRDDLLLRALEVGLSRRSGDLPALLAAWARAREAVLRYPIDLFTLLPLGELMVAGARLEDSERLGPSLAQAQALLTRLGHPQLWATPMHWSGAQAAILADDPAGLRPHAAALVAAARTSPYAATLARAGRCWLRVLTGDIDAAGVEHAAHELAAVGLAWDGSRLAGQAAARTPDPRIRTSLLSCARALNEANGLDGAAADPPQRSEHPAAAGGRLSDREREVARLVVAGQTYREIGGRLFISAKTVEHHVSRMRQRLGASTRSDLLARLRAEIAEGA
jgi:DNA-binding CsgD family transcriptional regulator